MVTPSAGSVVLVPFPFSDLSASKLRPAIVPAGAGRGDWVLCQVMSNSYADPRAIELSDADFSSGSLQVISYVRPGKLFTASQGLITTLIGSLRAEAFERTIDAVIALLKP